MLSESINVTNSVQQGEILSPILVKLSEQLGNLSYGFHNNSECFSHIAYADNIVLLAASPNALQKLINVCSDYVNCDEILFNVKNTQCM